MISFSLLLLLPIFSSGGYVYQYHKQPKPYHAKLAHNTATNTGNGRPSYITHYARGNVPESPVHAPVIPAHLPVSPAYVPVSPKLTQVSTAYAPASPYNFGSSSYSNDIIKDTQTQAANLINILTTFSADKRVVDFVAANYGYSKCVNNLQEAITATQAASDLITRSGYQLKALINTYNQLKNEKAPVALLRGAATMLQQLDVLVPKLTNLPLTTQCRNSPEATITGMKDLARIISGLATSPANDFPAHVKNTLKQSASIVDASTDFVASIRNLFKNNDEFCSHDSQYTSKAVYALGELFDEVEKLLKALDMTNNDISEIRQKNLSLASGIVENLNKLQETGVSFVDCNTAGSYKGTAQNLLEVADVVEEVGLENLERQLGVKFNLQF